MWNACAWRQHVQTAGFSIVVLRFGDQGTKEMLAVVGLKVWPASSFAQQLPATRNIMQQDVQTDAHVTFNIVKFLEFHSTKQGVPLVDSWSGGLD